MLWALGVGVFLSFDRLNLPTVLRRCLLDLYFVPRERFPRGGSAHKFISSNEGQNLQVSPGTLSGILWCTNNINSCNDGQQSQWVNGDFDPL